MTETTDLMNAGEQIESNGKAYTFTHVGPSIRAAFSALLMARARQGLRDERREGRLSNAEYREEADALKARFDAGAYSWGSPLDPNDMGAAVVAALQETWGKLALAQLLLKPRHGEMSMEDVVTVAKGNAEAFGEAINECINPSPNADGPAKTLSRPTGTTTGATVPAA